MMKSFKHIVCPLVFCVLVSLPVGGNAQQLSDNSFISVLTCSPGAGLYSSWGHTAIRVCDPDGEMDYVFNYGTFNSAQPAFFWKFLKGDLLYCQSVTTFESFVEDYREEERTVWEQVLNLSAEQKLAVFRKLIFDSSEENRYYKYNYERDNCTTRVVDVVDQVLPADGKVVRGTAAFRRQMNQVLHRWELLMSLNVLMGRKGDAALPPSRYNCLPDIYMASLAGTQTNDGSPLVLSERLIVEGCYTPSRFMFWFFPLFLLSLLLGLGALKWLAPRYADAYLKAMLGFTMLLTGLVGAISVFLWSVGFLLADSNINIMWVMPLNLILMPFVFKHRRLRNIVVNCNLLLTALSIVLIASGVQGIEFQSLSFLLFAFITYCLCRIFLVKKRKQG